MDIRTLEVDGIGPAIHAMRNPMDSWSCSDTHQGKIGEKDKELSQKLAKAGPEHAKHLRMVMVWVEIRAPRFWWNEMDTYRQGVEKLSCSTMHKLMSRPLEPEDFEMIEDGWPEPLPELIAWLNRQIEDYKAEENPKQKHLIWQGVIHMLPQSYLQRRTVMLSYATLRNIIKQRTGHKLKEWAEFVEWAKTLPESWMLFDE